MFKDNCDPIVVGGVTTSSIQFSPLRNQIYAIDRCADSVIGFEFVQKSLVVRQNNLCNNVLVNLCVPVNSVSPMDIKSARFIATEDTCFKDYKIDQSTAPFVEIQRDSANLATGILIRFFKPDTCCYPLQMAFRLLIIDQNDCEIIISKGILYLR